MIQPLPAPNPFAGLARWPLLRAALLMLAATLLLGWLFRQADTLTSPEPQHYGRELRRLLNIDAELDTAVLASGEGLQRDFDGITTSMREFTELGASVATVPAFLGEADRRRLGAEIAALRAVVAEKAELVDRFKRETSVLRNSLAYFPAATDRLIEEGMLPPAVSRQTGIVARNVMGFVLDAQPMRAAEMWERLDQLAIVALTLPPAQRERVVNLIAHGRIILDRKPVLDTITRDILALPTGARAESVIHAYVDGYQHATDRAHTYRVLLFVVALGLAGYLMIAILRLQRTSLALAGANEHLEERIQTLRLTESELHLYANVFTNASEGMAITDAQARIVAVNPAFTDITGYSIEEIHGRTPAVLASGRQDAAFYREMWATLGKRGQWQGEIWNRRRSGEIYPEWLSITAITEGDGSVSHYIGIFSDITDRKESEARIRHLAHHDALTGLPNRLLLQDRLGQAILKARRNSTQAAVLFLDLDRFKTINDTLGHEIGDGLLRQVTQRCLGAVRETDTVARQGGDEFVIVLPDLEHGQDAGTIARKILAALTEPCRLGPHELTVTGSIGIALYPGDGADPSMLLRNADAAMYRAKADGRNGFQFYAADMNTHSLGELLLEHQLRGALDRNELRLYFQPKVNAADGCIEGCEALLRWQHPDLGLLAPGRFVPAAEESGLIVPIGEWVLREACRQLRAWIDAGLAPVPVAVNLSGQQFAHQDIVALVREALAEHRLPAPMLELELTETMLMRDLERTIATLAELRAMGVTLAIDDFGTGYSSLAYLRQFDVNALKIDRSFVHDIRPGSSDGKIATAVIALAHNLGLTVTAEGVETAAQQHFLARHGCDQLQGFLFGQPEPAEAFAQRLADDDRRAPHVRLVSAH
ncbi:EAL/GGDEF/PAS/PAC-domain-containing signaling protein [Azoarcus olearius]|uniref:EAL domain-containing protein n=1 Tax=Azoarcus sp. (strain BH72) TaxID=418699 RepID=UPI00080609F2|nr:EAL domain-containing protein [Azoarcus olearius]ANQ84446.1 EAL/GGDEF/PAS/PAC-domain-containing signaling protein [Azoarcus olearius]